MHGEFFNNFITAHEHTQEISAIFVSLMLIFCRNVHVHSRSVLVHVSPGSLCFDTIKQRTDRNGRPYHVTFYGCNSWVSTYRISICPTKKIRKKRIQYIFFLFLELGRSGGGVVDNTLDYQSWDRKIDPPLLRSFG